MTTDSYLRDRIKERMLDLGHEKLVVLGYWCPRCDVIAFPSEQEGPGWCPFCGMDPRDEGPRKPQRELRGISA
jgi:hypothetical protein